MNNIASNSAGNIPANAPTSEQSSETSLKISGEAASKTLEDAISTAIASHLNPEYLARIGIDASEIDSIRENARLIAEDPSSPQVKLNQSGEQALSQTQNILSDESLAALGKMGEKVSELVSFSEDQPTTQVEKMVSGIPIVGKRIYKIIPGVKRKYRDSQSIADNISKVSAYAANQEKILTERAIEANSVLESIARTAVSVSAQAISFRIALEQTQAELTKLKSQKELTDFERTKITTLESKVFRITNRVRSYTNLYAQLMSALPRLTIAQQSAATLADKMNVLKDIVAPILTYEAYISLTNNLTAKAIEYTESIESTTNRMMRENADSTKDNAIRAIRSTQTPTIEDETLKHIYKRLQETQAEVSKELSQASLALSNNPAKMLEQTNPLAISGK